MDHSVWHACISFTWKSPEVLCAFLLDCAMAPAMAAAPARREENASEFPKAPCVFFKTLSSCLAYHGSVNNEHNKMWQDN